jgi:Domain of unknown function (DUF4440)
MHPDSDSLRELNLKIGTAEADGDRTFLADVLAPAFAFRRASGTLVDRAAFLDAVKPSAHRETEIESITLHGKARALVSCIVTLLDGDQHQRFHNLRFFVRTDDAWKLLAWANEPL